VYVPYYDPAVVYGPWWWPAYPPVYWGPPLGYYAWGAYAPGFYWGPAIAFSWGFFFGHADWHHRHVSVVHGHPHQPAHGMPYGKPVKWQHDPVHRRNVPYRHTVSRQPFGQPLATRGDDRARPTVRRESHDTEPRARGVTQQMRPQFAAPQSRPEHNAPQARDRLPDRAARAEIQRPQSRVPDPRPAAAVPRAAPAPRPFTPAPVARAEPRPAPPAANSRVIPRQQPVPSPRAELPAPARAGSMIPRAAANAPSFVPRMDGNSSRSIARPHAGTVRERPAASHGSRHSNRRS
jgi:hypothetical protein